MNRIKCVAMQCKLLTIALILWGFAPKLSASSTSDVEISIEERIMSLGSSVDIRYNAEVNRRINQYTIDQRHTSERLLGRSSLYFPLFESILKEKGLPLDLKYLSVVESGLRPHATSRSGAAGLWQFMRPTGKMMGLKITKTIDERRDIEKSTIAAAEYLSYLYEKFGDWTLAIAAYNCGPGNLRKAIRQAGGKRSFWDIKKYLPKETREYVPKFIAMTYVMNYYQAHDLIPEMPSELFTNTSSAKVFEKIDLDHLSLELNLDIDVMMTLNPSYIRNYIPMTADGEYQLVLPTPEMRLVALKYNVLAALPILVEKKEVIKIFVTPRPMMNLDRLPSAHNIGSTDRKQPFRIFSMNLQPVRMGSEEEEVENFDLHAFSNHQKKSLMRRTIYNLPTSHK